MSVFAPSLANIGISSFLWFVTLIIIFLVIWRSRGRYLRGTTLVLRKFRLNEDSSAQPVLEIRGRPSGIIGYFLTLFRLDADHQLTVTGSSVSIQEASLSGFLNHHIPLRNVSSTACGYQRSILALIFAIFFAAGFVINFFTAIVASNRNNISGDMSASFLFLVFAAICAVVYFLSKKIGISVETTGGNHRGLVFKRSVIENLSVDLPQAIRAVEAINSRLLGATGMRDTIAPSESTAPEPSCQAPCPQCSAANPTGSRFCESCGFALS